MRPLVSLLVFFLLLLAASGQAADRFHLPAEAFILYGPDGPSRNETNQVRVLYEFNQVTEVVSYWENVETEMPAVARGELGSDREETVQFEIADVDWFAYGFDFKGRTQPVPWAHVYTFHGPWSVRHDEIPDGPSITITNESINIGPAPMRAPYQILIGNGTDLANITSMVALPHNETSLPRPGGVVVAAWLVDVEWLHWSQKVGGGVCHPGCEVPRYVVFDGLNVTLPEAPDPVSDAPVPESPGVQESPLPLVLVVLALVAALRRR